MTATGFLRRVSSMRSRLSNSCTIWRRSCLASAMEYRLDTTYSSHGYLDSYFIEGQVVANVRRDDGLVVGLKENSVYVAWEKMWLEHLSLWLRDQSGKR